MMRLTPRTLFFAAPSTILIGIGLFEIYVDVFVHNNFISNKVLYLWAGIAWAFIGYLLKNVDWSLDSEVTEGSPLFSDKEIREFKLMFGGSGLICVAGVLSSTNGLVAFGSMILGFTAFAFVIMCFVRGTQKGVPYMLDYAQNSVVSPPENLYSIIGPVLLLLTLSLPWIYVVEIPVTGSLLFQERRLLVMCVVLVSVVPIIQYAVRKNEEFPMIPPVCFGIVALCDLLLINDVETASGTLTDIFETEVLSSGSGLILNLVLSALLAFFSFQAQTESGVQNEFSYEEKQESRVHTDSIEAKGDIVLTRELEKLKKMSDDGILDADEFKAAKGKLLK